MTDLNTVTSTTDKESVVSSSISICVNEDDKVVNDGTIVVDDVGSCSSVEYVKFVDHLDNDEDDFCNLASALDPATVSQTLFQAVASNDYSSLVGLYAKHSCVSIVQFLQMKRRWILEKEATHRHHRRKNDTSADSDDFGAEAKLEELLEQFDYSDQQMKLPYSYGVRGYSSLDKAKSTSNLEDETYIRLLHELTTFLKDQSIASTTASASHSISTKFSSNKVTEGSEKNRPINKKPKSAILEASISSSVYEAERLLHDMASILSDTRPPANFVVYSPNANNTSSTPNSTNAPPLFDGSVANATPPALGGVDGGGATAAAAFAAAASGGISSSVVAGGGAGTILHLACALDVPLCLAFVLSMGADARACHTAFRRLLIHEAACNGSIQCLQLLLELGQYYDDCYSRQQSVQPNSYKAGLKSPANTMNFPYAYPNRKRGVKQQESGRSVSPTLSFHRGYSTPADFDIKRESAQLDTPRVRRIQHIKGGNNYGGLLFCDPNKEHDGDEEWIDDSFEEEQPFGTLQSLDFVSSLHLFRDLSRQVKAGTISELDAARKVMFHATLSEVSQYAIAKSCTYHRLDMVSSGSSGLDRDRCEAAFNHPLGNNRLWRLPQANSGRSDGHGNTPLHWAAFKNETACVKLLLEYNADPNARANPSGWTPLHDAAYSNGHGAIRLLLDNGAHVDSRANSGATPLCFAAQEDAAEAACLLLERGADLTIRCAATYNNNVGGDHQPPGGNVSRFSGYTPLHYCAHYNAKNAARVLLQHPSAKEAMEVTDFNDRLPIHVAVARGSSDVLRELLRAGARVETRVLSSQSSNGSESSLNTSTTSNNSIRERSERRTSRRANRSNSNTSTVEATARVVTPVSLTSGSGPDYNSRPSTPRRHRIRNRSSSSDSLRSQPQTPNTPSVASPLLRSMIPSQPVVSSKPWNCLSQRSIDECRRLITEVEQNWTPDRHSLFTPTDRKAVAALLLVGKRFETERNIFVDVWPEILSFCGRGWFEKDTDDKDESMVDETESSLSSDYMEEDIIQGRYALSRPDNTGDTTADELSLPTFC